jgi:tyrosyl-tRNA synthetase
MAAKKALALDITRQFHGQFKAQEAQANFENTIQQKAIPLDIPIKEVTNQTTTILELCKQIEAGESSGQIKRTISQGGVQINDKKITDHNQKITIRDGDVLKFGKRTYTELRIKK